MCLVQSFRTGSTPQKMFTVLSTAGHVLCAKLYNRLNNSEVKTLRTLNTAGHASSAKGVAPGRGHSQAVAL